MQRRHFLGAAAGLGMAQWLGAPVRAQDDAPSDIRITGIRIFNPTDTGNLSGWLNLSEIIVAIDTDAGVTGWGQGGSPDLLTYAGGLLIGEDPLRTEYLWQRMYRSSIYPAGRERLLAIGALDTALWDIKAKLFGQPLYQLLGGRARDHVECYRSFGGVQPAQARDIGRRTMDEGFRAVRFHTVPTGDNVFDGRRMIDAFTAVAEALRAGVGDDGEFIIDAHTRFDFADVALLCDRMAPLEPLFVEDPLHTIDDYELFAALRQRVTVPLAAGEQFGDLRDGNLPLVERGLIDYLRSSIPNVGGVTSFRKIAAICEAHSVTVVPHFTSPISTAAVIHSILPLPGAVMNEVFRIDLPTYLDAGYVFRDGKMHPSDLPGIGVVVREGDLNLLTTLTERPPASLYQGQSVFRPDGSHLYL